MPFPSAGGIIANKDGKIVLVEQHTNTWSFPKGGIDQGETALEAAVREIGEETGLKELACLGEVGTYERYSIGLNGVSERLDLGLRPRTLFLFTTNENVLVPDGLETTSADWFSFDEAVARLSHPKDKEFLKSSYGKVYALLQEVGIELK